MAELLLRSALGRIARRIIELKPVGWGILPIIKLSLYPLIVTFLSGNLLLSVAMPVAIDRRNCLANDYSTVYQPRFFLALQNNRIQALSSPQSDGAHDCCTVRNIRSGCGIIIVTLPSALLTPAIPAGEPLGLSG